MDYEKIIKEALDFYTDEAYNKYVREHPESDMAKHRRKITPPGSKGRKRKILNLRTKQREDARATGVEVIPEKEFDGSNYWMDEHTIESHDGSILSGVPQLNDESKQYINQKLIPKILEIANAAKKKIFFLSSNKPEQKMVADALKEKGKDITEEDWNEKSGMKRIKNLEDDGNIAIAIIDASSAFELKKKQRINFENMLYHNLRRKHPSRMITPTPKQPIPYPTPPRPIYPTV